MPLDLSALKIDIDKIIDEISIEYQSAKGMILSEADLKCLLFKKLLSIESISINSQTATNGLTASYIHAEVPWFDENNKLKIKPDITILEPEQLHLRKNDTLPKIPSKGFIGFLGKAIIFELKFIKRKSGINKKIFDEQINHDYEKISRLFNSFRNGNQNDVFCYFVIFNKTNFSCPEFTQFLENNSESDRHKIIYKTGNFVF